MPMTDDDIKGKNIVDVFQSPELQSESMELAEKMLKASEGHTPVVLAAAAMKLTASVATTFAGNQDMFLGATWSAFKALIMMGLENGMEDTRKVLMEYTETGELNVTGGAIVSQAHAIGPDGTIQSVENVGDFIKAREKLDAERRARRS